jgi:SAM-dependent methyltransferase
MLGRVIREILGRSPAAAAARDVSIRDEGSLSLDALQAHLPQLLLARYEHLRRAWLEQHGPLVQGGPFAGMRYHEQSLEGCYLPKVMGTYEAELFDVLRALPAAGYEQVLNIGCADGYYAVGLARLLPGVPVWCCDTDPRAVAATQALAEANGVATQVTAEHYTFVPDDFAGRAGKRTLLLMDIEGEELRLLDATAVAALAATDLVVEVHDCYAAGMSDVLAARFSQGHAVVRLARRDLRLQMPDCTAQWSDLDRALAVSEWRIGPTPWLWMRARPRESGRDSAA